MFPLQPFISLFGGVRTAEGTWVFLLVAINLVAQEQHPPPWCELAQARFVSLQQWALCQPFGSVIKCSAPAGADCIYKMEGAWSSAD